jgi:carbon monoxide dehydrogenase subunit G
VKLSGSYVLPGPPEAVWELLTDPARLAKCLPGCESLQNAGDDRYTVKAKFAIAAIGGSFSGAVTLTEKKPPCSLKMRIEGRGAPGHLTGEGRIELGERGNQTEVRYDGSAQVGGLIAAVGQRMIEAAAKRIVGQFFENAAQALSEERGA